MRAAEALNYWISLDAEPNHKPPCLCGRCYFWEHKRSGLRPSKSRHFLAWLIHREKIKFLIKSRKVEEERMFADQCVYLVEPGEWEKAEFRPGVIKTLQKLHDLKGDEIFLRLIESFDLCASLILEPEQLEMKQKSALKRSLEGQKSPDSGLKPFRNAARVARFVRRSSNIEVTRRELERRLKMTKRDLGEEKLCALLKSNYNIMRFKRGRSVVYRKGQVCRILFDKDGNPTSKEISFPGPQMLIKSHAALLQ